MRTRTMIAATSLMLLFLNGAGRARAQAWHRGVAVLGDSYSDEYRFYPPDRAAARNWVEILAETRSVDFGPFTTSDRGEPRHQGYAYNWARSGATTASMLAQGQHTGAAAQVARGEVGLVWVFIGGNDFINALWSEDPPAVLPEAALRAGANVRTAVETLLGAGPDVRVVLLTVPDVADLPEFEEQFSSGRMPRSWAVAADQAVRRCNAELLAWRGRDPRITVVDVYWPVKLLARAGRESVPIAGRRLNRHGFGNDLDHVFLNDRRHVGTLAQGLMAQLFLTTVNARFHAGLAPLRDEELVRFAESGTTSPGGILVESRRADELHGQSN